MVNGMIRINNSIAKHGGKMEGIPSISTSCLCNPYCMSCGAGAVCNNCYAKKFLKLRKTLREKTARNFAMYTTETITSADVPTFNAKYFRFEAFGELHNVKQFENYMTIVWNNPETNFAIWTKRPEIIRDYTDAAVLPENINIILSSVNVNHSDYNKYVEQYGDFIDACFTVYDKKYAAENNITINCHGGRGACLQCGTCYRSIDHDAAPLIINEILK